jgi:hypothetical protein
MEGSPQICDLKGLAHFAALFLRAILVDEARWSRTPVARRSALWSRACGRREG